MRDFVLKTHIAKFSTRLFPVCLPVTALRWAYIIILDNWAFASASIKKSRGANRGVFLLFIGAVKKVCARRMKANVRWFVVFIAACSILHLVQTPFSCVNHSYAINIITAYVCLWVCRFQEIEKQTNKQENPYRSLATLLFRRLAFFLLKCLNSILFLFLFSSLVAFLVLDINGAVAIGGSESFGQWCAECLRFNAER